MGDRMSMVDSEDVPAVASAPSPVARAPLPRWTVPVVAVLVLGVAAVAAVLLWRWIDELTLTDAVAEKKATAHLDVLKLTASIAVGGGGLFALYLAARRQRTQELELAQRERVQVHAELMAEHSRVDAVERRITELYLKAVEQLGSAAAAVRLGGLYALERLAQDNPSQRSTVVSVLCAYLRMPFELPGEPPELAVGPEYEAALALYRERVQEREVRIAAQRILRDHLQPGDGSQPAATFWPDTDLDLTGSHLIDFDLNHCTIRTARFRSATFSGPAYFGSATFTGSASFGSATFTNDASFISATFTGHASFISATFTDVAIFRSATFTGSASFESTTFTNDARFEMVTFSGPAYFGSATFTSDAGFEFVTFSGSANFKSATFDQGVPQQVRGFLASTE